MKIGGDFVAGHDQTLATAREMLEKRPTVFALVVFGGTAQDAIAACKEADRGGTAAISIDVCMLGPTPLVESLLMVAIRENRSDPDELLGRPPESM